MILLVMVCVTYFIFIFNSFLMISFLLVGIMPKCFNYENVFIHFNIKSDVLKPEEKLNITRDNIIDYNAMYTMTSRIMNSVQRNII